MLRIHPTILEMIANVRDYLAMIADVRHYADTIAAKDRDLARQLRRSSMSVLLNEAEGSGGRGGTRRARYDDALGSARETYAGLEGAEAAGYIESFRPDSRHKLDAVIGTFVRLLHRR